MEHRMVMKRLAAMGVQRERADARVHRSHYTGNQPQYPAHGRQRVGSSRSQSHSSQSGFGSHAVHQQASSGSRGRSQDRWEQDGSRHSAAADVRNVAQQESRGRSKFAVLQRLPSFPSYEDAASMLALAAKPPAPVKPLRADILGVSNPVPPPNMPLYHRRLLSKQMRTGSTPPPSSPPASLPHFRTGCSVWGVKRPRKAQSNKPSQYARKK